MCIIYILIYFELNDSSPKLDVVLQLLLRSSLKVSKQGLSLSSSCSGIGFWKSREWKQSLPRILLVLLVSLVHAREGCM